MKRHITHRRKYTLKKKNIRRKSVRRKSVSQKYKNKKGGVNNQNNIFDDRRSELINRLQDIINNIDLQTDPFNYIDEIRELREEAQEIDDHYENDDMRQQLLQRIQDIHNMYEMDYLNGNAERILNDNNNNNTATLPSPNNGNNSNNGSNSNNDGISVMGKKIIIKMN